LRPYLSTNPPDRQQIERVLAEATESQSPDAMGVPDRYCGGVLDPGDFFVNG